MADTTKMTPQERAFHQECIDGSKTLQKEHGYNPTYFLNMVHEHGGVAAVKLLLKTRNFQDGLTRLWELRQLSRSIEAAVLLPRWSALFDETEKAEARKRLKALEYDPVTDRYDVKG